jgi:phosphate transport system protein
MERVVRHFQEELDILKTRLLEMGGPRGGARTPRRAGPGRARSRRWSTGFSAATSRSTSCTSKVDDRCLKLLALHQPMAADLRAIMAAVKINTDLERVGDLAVNIAEAAKRYSTHPPVKKLIDIPRMADIAQAMLRDALDAYVKRDVALAQRVLNEDDTLDSLKTLIFRELLTIMLKDPSTIEGALDLILVSRHLERIGDHATNVAEDVIFMVSARDVRHHAPEPDLQQH